CPTWRRLRQGGPVGCPQASEASGSGGLVGSRNYGLGGARLRQGEPAPLGLAEARLVFLELDLAGERRMHGGHDVAESQLTVDGGQRIESTDPACRNLRARFVGSAGTTGNHRQSGWGPATARAG